jgi:type VI secretion system protein ImpE
MDAEDFVAQGRLDDALKSLQDVVRRNPADAKWRVFLFQLLAVRGEWDRALNQLNVAAELDPLNLAMAQTYREALACEALRSAVFSGARSPVVFGTPSQWTAELLDALRLAATGEIDASQKLRDRAFDAAPAVSGTLNGERFEWIADADARLGPMIEVVVNGRYCWVPFSNISEIRLEPPSDLRDLVWLPAEFTWSNGGEMVGLIPARYPSTEKSADDLLRLARRTDWVDQGAELFFGLGQRLLATDQGEYPLFEVREICFDERPTQGAGDNADDARPAGPAVAE